MNDEGKALAERLASVADVRGGLELALCMETGRHHIDLNHPSNEGHLRLLAEEVLGRPVGIKFIRGGCRVEVINPSPDAWKVVHPTPGQAYAAAIVAAKEEG